MEFDAVTLSHDQFRATLDPLDQHEGNKTLLGIASTPNWRKIKGEEVRLEAMKVGRKVA